MGRAGRKELSSAEPREHWSETHPDRHLWTEAQRVHAGMQTQEEYEALYGRSPAREEARLPFFLQEEDTWELSSPLQRQLPGNHFYWIDEEQCVRSRARIIALLDQELPARASVCDNKLALLTEEGELHIYRVNPMAPVKMSLDVPRRGNLHTLENGVLVYDGNRVLFQSFADLPAAPLEDVFRGSTTVPEHSHVDVFAPGREGALLIHRGDYSLYEISYIESSGSVRTLHENINSRFRGARDMVHCQRGDKVVLACSIGGKDPALYSLDFQDTGFQKVLDLERVPREITSLGDSLLLLYDDGDYQLVRNNKIESEGRMPDNVSLGIGRAVSVSRDRCKIQNLVPAFS